MHRIPPARSRLHCTHRLLAAAGLTTAALFCVQPAAAQDRFQRFIAQTKPRTPAEQQKLFHLPPGFRIELVAGEPEVRKPININFDARGWLYVTESVEYPFPAPPDRPGRDAIKVIADSDCDGVPDKVTTFADGLSIPIGVTPIAGGILGYSIPHVYRFPDRDGDGTADGREVAYSGFGYRDTHGMINSLTWWIDGWVYGCHGYSNASTVKGNEGEAVRMQSGNTYRLRPDGSRIEHFTHGQVNPFGLAFDPLGNVYTADCHTKPAYLLVRGASYPSFGKPHDGLGFGPEMMRHGHGSTGIAGIVYYAAEQFPKDYRDTLFIGNPITGRINHDRLEARGSTYRAIELPDFVRCDDPWFRPVDLQLAPDGSIYVADFYNRIIGHYEVPLNHPLRDRERGRIWRIVYVGESGDDDVPAERGTASAPRDLTKASADELLDALADPNLTVRTHATHELVHRIGPAAVERIKSLLDGESTAAQRAHGLWVLFRLDALDAKTAQRLAGDGERIVRVHLVKALAERSEWTDADRQLVLARLGDEDAFVRRAAADALGRHPHAEIIEPLLELWQATPDEDAQLIHTVRIALRDTVQHLRNLPELTRRYADHPKRLERLADISLGIRSPQSAASLLAFYSKNPLAGPRTAEIVQHIGRHAEPTSLPQLYELARKVSEGNDGLQIEVVTALHRATQQRGTNLPKDITAWGTTLVSSLLDSRDGGTVNRGLDLAREMRLPETAERLAILAGVNAPHPGLRRNATSALIAVDRTRAADMLAGFVADPATPPPDRPWAAETLGAVNTAAGRKLLVEQLKVAPESLALPIARGLSASREGAEALLAAVEQGLASPRLLQDLRVGGQLTGSGLPNVQERTAKLLKGVPPIDERLQTLLAERRSGFQKASPDLAAGAKLFEKSCAACHRIGEEGVKIGPELDGIGERGLDRLLEDVLDPNRNVDVSFRATVLVLQDGRNMTGLVRRQEGNVLLVVDSEGKEHRVPLADIEIQRQLAISPMPADVAEKLPAAEFFDLMGYLLSRRRETGASDR